MRFLVLGFVLAFSLSALRAQAQTPSPCTKVAMGAAYNTVMHQIANEWHLVNFKPLGNNVFEVSLHNDEDGYYTYVVATKLDPQTGVCHVTALKQVQ